MTSLLQAIHDCILGPSHNQLHLKPSEKAKASDIIHLLLTTNNPATHLKKQTQEILGPTSWTTNLAKSILFGIEDALKKGVTLGETMSAAYLKAVEEAKGFVKEHPYYSALIAVGILVLLMPWVLEVLGFSELGPVEGSFAAWWQSTYGGYVTEDSLFAFFQRLGMVWHR